MGGGDTMSDETYNMFVQELQAHIKGEVRMDEWNRGLYATDAGNYQIMPLGRVAAPGRRGCAARGLHCSEIWTADPSKGWRNQSGGTNRGARAGDRFFQVYESRPAK